MWSIGEIADRDKVSKQAVSKTVAGIRAEKGDEDWIEFDARGRVAKVSVAHYDEYRQRFVNPAKASAPLRPVETAPIARQEDSFDEARRQSEWIKVERERLRLQEQTGQLIRADVQREAARRVGVEIQAIVNRLPNKADDLAARFTAGGVHGLMLELRKVAGEMLTQIAGKLDDIAAAAPDEDALIEED